MSKWPATPYLVGAPVYDEARFADRETLLEQLQAMAQEPNRTGFMLRGPRRAGKTSLLTRFARLMAAEAHTVQINLVSHLSATDSWRPHTVTPTVLNAICEELQQKDPQIPFVAADGSALQPDVLIPDFRRRILPEMIKAVAPKRLIILLDELEVADARDPHAPREIAAALQPLSSTKGIPHLFGMVWGRPFGQGLPSGVPDLMKDFLRLDVSRFDRAATKLAIGAPLNGIYPWSDGAADRVWQLTAGHPLFVAALGAAVHTSRTRGNPKPVAKDELTPKVIDEALRLAETWSDAWRQLNRIQQLFLLALAEDPGADIAKIVERTKSWGVPYDANDFIPFLKGLEDDELITRSDRGYVFQVEMARCWVGQQTASDILSAPDSIHLATKPDALRYEHEGRSSFAQGEIQRAAQSFRTAFDLDPDRVSSAVWLGESLLQLGRAEEAVQLLRSASPNPEIYRIRAKALAVCLQAAFDAHGDTAPLITEMRSVDPYLQTIPHAAKLIARIEVEEWWSQIDQSTTESLSSATESYILTHNENIAAALHRLRTEIEDLLVHGTNADKLIKLVCEVAPLLLLGSEPLVAPEEVQPTTREASPAAFAQWRLCYDAIIRVFYRLRNGNSAVGLDGLPPAAILQMLRCRASSGPLGKQLRVLVLETATPDRVTRLVLSDPEAARTASEALLAVDPDEALTRLQRSFGDAALAQGRSEVESALNAMPGLGLSIVRLADKCEAEIRNAYLRDLINESAFIIDRLQSDPECFSVAIEPEQIRQWQTLISAFVPVEKSEAVRLQAVLSDRMHSDAEGEAPNPRGRPGLRVIDANAIKAVLGNAYEVERPVPYRIYGIPQGYVSAWSVTRSGRNLLARAYRIDAGEPTVRAFLSHLWENERRLLSNLGTHFEGRALPRLYLARLDPSRGLLVLVTDFVGPKSLRELLSSGEIAALRRSSRSKFWKHLQGIIDALGGLHRAGYIHRAIRPENVMVDPQGHSDHKRQWLRLTNFEWSVYLYGIASSSAQTLRLRDRYVAPEQLALHRPSRAAAGGPLPDREHFGEGTASDMFALGLLIFECTIRPLHRDELAPIDWQYGVREHCAWIDTLRDEVDRALQNGDIWSGEAYLIYRLLKADVTQRSADIESISREIFNFSRQDTPKAAARDAGPLQLVTTLELGTPESITKFIKEELPEIEFRDLPSVAEWIREELRGAEVFPNRRAGAPILLRGKTLNFTVEPFSFHGSSYRSVGWLKVGKQHDTPAGQSVGSLSSEVEVHSYRTVMRLSALLTAKGSWESWFEAVELLREGFTNDERAFVERLRWSIQLERQSWEQQVLPYEIAEYTPGKRIGDTDVVLIKDRGDGRGGHRQKDGTGRRGYAIADIMAQSADRQNVFFELGPERDPTAAFHHGRRWNQESSEGDASCVRLTRYRQEDNLDPSPKGWIRPYSLAGHRAIYKRRKEVLADIERDPYLVRSLLSPEETFDDLNLPVETAFNARLDSDKLELCAAIQNRRPLFVVQGPPGTGKTTLAAEVILRTLAEQPSARILVVAQAHDPLNNLLERVESALDDWQKLNRGPRPTSVRLTSEERLDERRYGSEGTRVPRKYHPSRVAAKIIDEARSWSGAKEGFQPEVIDLWRQLSVSQSLNGISRSLEHRLVSSANLVYATANDRRLAALRPGSFDLVIYEEAAKAFPVEVLGPLRLARRWLLIGDQAQLPPFGLQDVESALTSDVDRLRRDYRLGHPLAADTRGIDPSSILGDGTPRSDIWAGIFQEMSRLLRFFNYVHNQASRVPLLNSIPAAGAATSPVVRGLSGMLTTQWRMHPVIGDFVSKCFYRGAVKNGDPVKLTIWRRHGIAAPAFLKDQAIVWLDVPWVMDQELAAERPGFGGGYENGFEARAVIGFLRQLLIQRRPNFSFAVMSPYRAQIRALSRMTKDLQFPNVDDFAASLHTADSFQGKQADVVVVSLVRNRRPYAGPMEQQIRQGLGFLENPERSTVIFSRAEKLLVVAGSMNHFKQFPDTRMYDVVKEVEALALRKKSGVSIVPATDLIDLRFWDHLKRDHASRNRGANAADRYSQ